jgi:catechol 2,3-dioxygenase-like lactoylglutathione lyase family enzyme
MIDHFGIDCADLAASETFYDRVLGTLGLTRQMHLAFTAPDTDHVRAFHAAATELGAETLPAPRLWPEYHEHFCGAFVRDPDGDNVEAVCHTAGPGD